MKLVVAIMAKPDANTVAKELTINGYSSTRTAAFGGFLQNDKTMLFVGVGAINVDNVLRIIEEFSSSREETVPEDSVPAPSELFTIPAHVTVGGAVVFVLDVEQFVKL